jgi:hypothetical protein
LSAGLLDLLGFPNPRQAIVWFKLLHYFWRIVDERETSRLAATVLSSEAENRDLALVGFVKFREFYANFVLRDIGVVGVEDITTESEERVRSHM